MGGTPWREGRGGEAKKREGEGGLREADRPRWRGKDMDAEDTVGTQFSCSYHSKSSGRASVSAADRSLGN